MNRALIPCALVSLLLVLQGSVGCSGANASTSLDGDDPAYDVLFHALVGNLDSLGLHELLEELFLHLIHLGHEVVDVGHVAIVEGAEVGVEVTELVGLLERGIKHVHGHVQVEGLVELLLLIIIVVIKVSIFLVVVHEAQAAISPLFFLAIFLSSPLGILGRFSRAATASGPILLRLTVLGLLILLHVIVLIRILKVILVIAVAVLIVIVLIIIIIRGLDLFLSRLLQGLGLLLLELVEHGNDLLDDL